MLALVVEDDASLRVIYQRVLEPLGFQVVEAIDGAEALAFLEKNTPDIIFLDMLLPNVNGVIVLNYIAAEPRLQTALTVIVSSNKQFERMQQPNLRVKFILKPIRPTEIRELATQVLQGG
ncbi:MAG: response regulator [Anaerolineae bacterium]|jgi:CheY-like chemotaxis protein|nr:response regulator [Anaerolineae bacterium]